MARLGGILAGWLIATGPLVAVNIASNMGLLDQQEATLASAAALLAGVVLGGAVAGMLGARGRQDAVPTGAAIAGGGAAVLYVATLLGLMFIAAALDQTPPVITLDLPRVALALLGLAALLVLAALAAGAAAGRRARLAPTARRSVAQAKPPFPAASRPISPPAGAGVPRGVAPNSSADAARPYDAGGPPLGTRGSRPLAGRAPAGTRPAGPAGASPPPRQGPSRPLAPARPTAPPPERGGSWR